MCKTDKKWFKWKCDLIQFFITSQYIFDNKNAINLDWIFITAFLYGETVTTLKFYRRIVYAG